MCSMSTVSLFFLMLAVGAQDQTTDSTFSNTTSGEETAQQTAKTYNKGSTAHKENILRLEQKIDELYEKQADQFKLLKEFAQKRNKLLQSKPKIQCRDNCSRNCFEALRDGKPTGVYTLYTRSTDEHCKQFHAYCDAETQGGNWTVVLRRCDGSINFNRNYGECEIGFGNLNGEFFIGLKRLHWLTFDALQELLFIFEDFNGERAYAKYDFFAVGNYFEDYEIKLLGNYSGTAGDSLKQHVAAPFSTIDWDSDGDRSYNLAKEFGGPWWYRNRSPSSNLMSSYGERCGIDKSRMYIEGLIVPKCAVWSGFRAFDRDKSLKFVEMMIRPKNRRAQN